MKLRYSIFMKNLTWPQYLQQEQRKPYFESILNTINDDTEAGHIIYPPKHLWYNCMEMTPFDQVKVVILGQDPYHGPSEAHGLAFSVQAGVKIPPSLRNIYKELSTDLSLSTPKHGDLSTWAKQGVLLLNTSLSVRHKQPGSHAKIGWEIFTDHIIQTVNQAHPKLVFILWGKHAQSKKALIASRHLIIESPHPSPLSAHRGFLGSKPFSKANDWLKKHELTPIDWAIH